MDINNIFSQRLRILIDTSGLTMADFARRAGISHPSLTCYLQGAYKPKDDNIVKIASAFNVDPDWLRGRSDSMHIENAPADINERIPQERRELIEKVKTMSEEQFAKLKSILDLIG